MRNKENVTIVFANDKPTYSRFGTKYLADMLDLPRTHPGIHAEFM